MVGRDRMHRIRANLPGHAGDPAWSFEHHYRAYGFWASAIGAYQASGIMRWAGTTQFAALLKIEDPYAYRDRLTMPKFMINSAGDQYFLPDSSQFYFDGLVGEKYLRYVPNTNHSLKGSDAPESAFAFYEAIVAGRPRPRFSWSFEPDGSIRVKADTKPTAVAMWQAANPVARDFRLEAIGPAYRSSALEERGDGVYIAKPPEPAQGWVAYFIELTFPSGGLSPFRFTTGVRVAPRGAPLRSSAGNGAAALRIKPPMTAAPQATVASGAACRCLLERECPPLRLPLRSTPKADNLFGPCGWERRFGHGTRRTQAGRRSRRGHRRLQPAHGGG